MKRYLIILLSIIILSCQGKQKKAEESAEPTTSIEIENNNYSFGTIKELDSIEHSYVIKNIGKNPLVIKRIETTCGCTVPEWSKVPVKPNDKTTIKVVFTAKSGVVGKVQKSVIIQANTDSIFHFLNIGGEVIK